MRMKAKLLALVMTLALMLAVAASAGAVVDHDVILPSGYSSSYNYPVIYVMPENGYTNQAHGLARKLAAATEMDMIVVTPKFARGMDLYAEMDALIAEIDSKYNSIADPNFRAVAGTGVGGYMAYVLGLTDRGASGGSEVQTSPVRFGSIVSIRGDFVSKANPWTGYGSVLSYLESLTNDNMKNYYVYLDAPVDDAWTNMEGSTNDLGYQIIGFGNVPAYNEYTVRPGSFDAAFLKESVARVGDRLTQKMLTGLTTASVSMGTTVISSGANAVVNYTVDFSPVLDQYIGNGGIPVDLVLSTVDPVTGEVLAKVTVKNDVRVASGDSLSDVYSGTALNKVEGDSSNVVLSMNLLGGEIELASTTLMRAADPVIDGDHQILSLMGDWKFNYTKYTQLDPKTFTSETYADWSVVQPCLGNWTYGYGNINAATAGMPNNMYFDLLIAGSGYYAKEFTVPSDFDAEELVLVVGYMDDRGEAWINGTRVGGTGMTEAGASTGETTWAVFSHYDIPAGLLKRGETNTIVVRSYNDYLGGGGWYKGPVGIYSKTAFDSIFGTGETERFYEDSFYSDVIGAEVKYLINLPESYFESDRYYPTVYLLHQINSDHTSYRGDAVNEILDAGAKSGLFDEMIVVIPNSSEESWWSGDWADMVNEDLVPYIDENFRTIRDARYRMTAGCSMGGYGAMAVALRNPDEFSGAISFFGSLGKYGDSDGWPLTVAENTSAEYMDYFAMYFICGNQDSYGFGQPAIRLNQKLEEMNVDHFFFIENGEHNSAFYVPYFDDAFEYLRKNMYAADAPLSSIMTGGVDYNQRRKTLNIYTAALEGMSAYFHVIPDSEYTEDTTPMLNINLVLEVRDKKTGKLVKTVQIRDNNFKNEYDTNRFSLTAEDIFGEGSTADLRKYDYVLKGAAFDDELQEVGVPVTGIPEDADLPDTGDDSSIFLMIAMLAASVAGMAFISRKKVVG